MSAAGVYGWAGFELAGFAVLWHDWVLAGYAVMFLIFWVLAVTGTVEEAAL